jgi:hypothetical protein
MSGIVEYDEGLESDLICPRANFSLLTHVLFEQ